MRSLAVVLIGLTMSFTVGADAPGEVDAAIEFKRLGEVGASYSPLAMAFPQAFHRVVGTEDQICLRYTTGARLLKTEAKACVEAKYICAQTEEATLDAEVETHHVCGTDDVPALLDEALRRFNHP